VSQAQDKSIQDFMRMQEEGLGLELIRQELGANATRADALRFHRRLAQLTRRPCSFLDEELGIERG